MLEYNLRDLSHAETQRDLSHVVYHFKDQATTSYFLILHLKSLKPLSN